MRSAHLSLLLGALLLAPGTACSSPAQVRVSSCGGGPTASTHGQTVPLASCAGQVGMKNPAPSLSVKPGDIITVHGLGRGYSSPSSTVPTVLALATTAGTTAKFKALANGSATLTLATPFCLGAPRSDSLGDHFKQDCPALAVRVTG
jgi:hypothetical protein